MDGSHYHITTDEGAVVKLDVSPPRLAETYFRSRHKHLRCFPQCPNGKHHAQVFCGDSIVVTVSPISNSLTLQSKSISVCGEFRTVTEAKNALNLGDRVGESSMLERAMHATYVMENNNILRFALNPPRKWEYRGRLRIDELHVFIIYCVMEGCIVGRFLSNQFQIVAIKSKMEMIKPSEASSSMSDRESTPSSNVGLTPINVSEATQVVPSVHERHETHKRAKASIEQVGSSLPFRAISTIVTANQQDVSGARIVHCFPVMTAVVDRPSVLAYAPGYLGSALVDPLRVSTFQSSSPMVVGRPPVQQQFRSPTPTRTVYPMIRFQHFASYPYYLH